MNDSLQEVNRVTLPDMKERAPITNICFTTRKKALGVEFFVLLLKLDLTMHFFLCDFRAADLLSNSEPLLLKTYTTGFIYGGQKNHLIKLS